MTINKVEENDTISLIHDVQYIPVTRRGERVLRAGFGDE